MVCKGYSKEMDTLEKHAVNCGYRWGQESRHNAVRDIIVKFTKSTNLSPRVEEPGIIEGTQQRPADLKLPGFLIGRDTLLDVTVVNSLQRQGGGDSPHGQGGHEEGEGEVVSEEVAGQPNIQAGGLRDVVGVGQGSPPSWRGTRGRMRQRPTGSWCRE